MIQKAAEPLGFGTACTTCKLAKAGYGKTLNYHNFWLSWFWQNFKLP